MKCSNYCDFLCKKYMHTIIINSGHDTLKIVNSVFKIESKKLLVLLRIARTVDPLPSKKRHNKAMIIKEIFKYMSA